MTSVSQREESGGRRKRRQRPQREVMVPLSQQAEILQRMLGPRADQLAHETGFIQRERVLSGSDFAQALILGWLQQPDERVEGLVQILGRREVTITASGLSQRFTP